MALERVTHCAADLIVAEQFETGFAYYVVLAETQRFLGRAIDRRQPAFGIKRHHPAGDALKDVFIVAFDVLCVLLRD